MLPDYFELLDAELTANQQKAVDLLIEWHELWAAFGLV